jgi:exportin-T
VIPLAGSLLPSSSSSQLQLDPQNEGILSQLLTITYRQMRYAPDFQFDYEDEDEAEEEMYRTELRKLNQKFIRVAPETCLQFTCQALSQLPLPLSSAPTPDVEAALRLVYHYCEGIRPPPGMKVVMRNETFRNLLVALHTSDITFHSHREVLALYYETAVRYHPLLKERTELLQKVLESLTGQRGLQHEHSRVRSRCCYLLLRLVKSVGSSNASNSVLRPYVETAVSGIQGLLQNNSVQLRLDDTLNLFETIGLLLGKTGLDAAEQQRHLTQVITPHVRSIEQILEQKQAVAQEPEVYGEILSGSIAAIAFLSKGFKPPLPYGVQIVLLETLKIASVVLETLPNNEQVRNKSFVLLQRLIQCLGDKVLPSMPQLLYLLIAHCTAEDILDVAQLFNQSCIKFKSEAISAIDAGLLPFLRKCHALIATLSIATTNSQAATENVAAPHLRTEQLSIQKLTFTVLQHIVTHGATAVLLSPTNASSLENVLQSMSDGAIHVEDAPMKKTCLIFFKELLDQWTNETPRNGNTDTTPPAAFVVQGYLRFVCDVLIPGVIQSFCKDNFNAQDANQWRSVMEFAALLEIMKQRLVDVYYQDVLLGTLTNRLGCPAPLVEGFRNASNRKDIET